MDIEKLKKLVRDNPVQAAAGALAVLLVAGVVAFTIYLNGQGNNKGFAVEGSRLIVVKDGMTTADIAELLHEKKLVKNPAAFKMEARWKGLATKLQAGAYQIDGGMSNQQIVDVMVKGRIKQVRFTVPEGYSVAKTAKKLEAEGLGSADKFMAAAKDYAPYPYMQTDDSNVLFKAEGFIYPATYDFPVGISEQEMLKMMVAQFDKEMQSSGIAKTVAERNLPLRDVVFHTLREAILKGELKPGERLMELQLASKLGVSRTPIREAIRMLEQEGLAVTIPRRGAEVARMTEKDMKDVLQIREVLDELAVRLACDNITKEEIKELEKQMLQFENSTKQGDIKKIAEADVAFHDTIYHAAGNAKLVTMLDNMREQIYRYRVEYLKDENAYPTLIQEHRKILELLEKHEKEKVIEVMKVHVEKQAKVVKQIIRDQE